MERLDKNGSKVSVDFNSAPKNIVVGATPISADFIQGGQVTGKVLDADGMTVISDTVIGYRKL